MRLRLASTIAAAIGCFLLLAPGIARAEPPSCYFHLPRDVTTVAFGIYGGEVDSPVRLPVGTHATTKMVTVHLARREHPILLVLTAYNSTYWHLEIDKDAVVAAVVVLGYEPQAVANLPVNVPAGFSTFVDGKGRDCPGFLHAYERPSSKYSKLAAAIDDEFGRRIDEFYGRYRAICLPGSCPDAPKVSLWELLFAAKFEVPRSVVPVRFSGQIEQ